jgi:hypothetical protein
LINLEDLTNFFDNVSRELPPGNTAVAAEVSEHSGTSLCDTRMQAIGGTIVRELATGCLETRSPALPAAAHVASALGQKIETVEKTGNCLLPA